MTVENVGTLVVGAGQAGVAMSEHLTRAGAPHVVLERHRIAERWRSERWDSLVANGPAWHDRFPGLEFSDTPADGFAPKESVADYLSAYAEAFSAPIRCGVNVHEVRRIEGRTGFRIETCSGPLEADNVVAATGPFQKPLIPAVVPAKADVTQIHSNAYKSPDQLPEGSVLVVGAGSSGAQIADELLRSGREVYLSVGPHHRPPRAYRGLDYCWWLGVLGKWDVAALEPGLEHIAIAVSGAHGGETVDFRRMAARGMTLVGMTQDYDDGCLRFAPDLAENIAAGDENYLSVLDEADAYATRHGLDLPQEPTARAILPDPACMTDPILSLDLTEAGINSIIWATGYAFDFSWLKVNTFDEHNKPRHERGVAAERGIYFLGLPWLSGRSSSFIWGVWHDAKYIADHIEIQRSYAAYQASRA
jgi:putative flavoprotein involved in K+ transport